MTTTGGMNDAARANLLHRIRFFVFFGLAGDMMFFATLVVLFFARQAGTHMDPALPRADRRLAPNFLPPILFRIPQF